MSSQRDWDSEKDSKIDIKCFTLSDHVTSENYSHRMVGQSLILGGLLPVSPSTDPFHDRGISMILCAPRLNRPPRPGLPLVLNGLNLTVRAGSWKGREGLLMGAKMIFIYSMMC